MRRRDERFGAQTRYKALPDPLYDKTAAGETSETRFQPADFIFDAATNSCICPAGKKLYSSGSACTVNGRRHHKFKGTKRDCVPCPMRSRCLRHPERTAIRQVAFFDKNQRSPLRYTERMKHAIDSPAGEGSTAGASRSSNPCSSTFGTTSAWIASRCERNRK